LSPGGGRVILCALAVCLLALPQTDGVSIADEILEESITVPSWLEEEATVQVYLVQHGKAHPKDANPERSLTEHGHRETERVAAAVARLGVEVNQICHSGKTRAQQTADILGAALLPTAGVVAASGLDPQDAVQPVAERLLVEPRPVMLVGHLPFLARLAGFLLTGNPEREMVQFRNSAVVCLAREGARWQVAWILTPEMAQRAAP
jgi:phosphohistidine phosphatase